MGNKRSFLLLASVALNLYLVGNTYNYFGKSDFKKQKQKLRWSEEAAAEAEAVASISCSGHGTAYVDGSTLDGRAVCECHTCYAGPDCSISLPDSCPADADSGDPLFLEPFWMQHASSSAVVVSGWHRMSYRFSDQSYISEQLENQIRRVHDIARNAVTQGKYILFGGGSTQLLNAAVYALSFNLSAPATVVASIPSYPLYKLQTKFFENKKYEFKGDANSSYANTKNTVIEFVTSPNNPDGKLREVVSQGASVKAIYDHAYYWPHFTAIPAPADEDIMVFTISKLTGHAGSRFGWVFVKDKDVYNKMKDYIQMAEMGISRDTQVRALKLMRAIVEGQNYGKEIFDYSYNKMRDRWQNLSKIMSSSKRFSIQQIPPLYCNFFEKVRGPSPGYAWVKCEREEDRNCNEVLLKRGKIIGRGGNIFDYSDRYVRLSLLKGDDDFNSLLYHLQTLVSHEEEEDGTHII